MSTNACRTGTRVGIAWRPTPRRNAQATRGRHRWIYVHAAISSAFAQKAPLLPAHGVAPRVVRETLGHSKISLAMDTYSHVVPAFGRAVADRMDELLNERV